MTRKAVLLALLCLAGIATSASPHHPVATQGGPESVASISVTHEEDSSASPKDRPLIVHPVPIPSHSRPIPRLPQPEVIVVYKEIPSSVTGISGRSELIAWARTLLSPSEFLCLHEIVQREGTWNGVTRVNSSSGAYGIPQALPGSKMSWAGEDWRTNPRTQIRWMIHYVNSRYGSPCDAWVYWQQWHWY